MRSVQFSLILWLGQQVAAHGTVTKVTIGGKTYPGYSSDFKYSPEKNHDVVGWSADVEDQGFVSVDDINQPNIICHKQGANAALYAEVAAGDNVTLQWTKWPTSHHGPMLDYLADCSGDCTTVKKETLKFFKIDGVGMTDTSKNPPLFGDDVMIKAGSKWTVQIPSTIKAGNYVLRHETIALHEGFEGGAQFYPQCINLKVTGGGSDQPAGVLGTELYKAEDPGIHFDIYKKFKSTSDYPVPGPPLYGSGSTGTAPAAPAASPASGKPSTGSATPISYGDTAPKGYVPPAPAAAKPSTGSATPISYGDTAPKSYVPPAPAAPTTASAATAEYEKPAKACKKSSGGTHDKRRVHARDISIADSL